MGLREIAARFHDGLKEKSLFYRQLIENSEMKEKELKDLDALINLSELLSKKPKIEEFLPASFMVLENNFQFEKFVILLKNDVNEYSIFDGYGCREETYHKFKFRADSNFFSLLPKNDMDLFDSNSFPWELFFSEEDHKESNQLIFIPLRIETEIYGYLVILRVPSNMEIPWMRKLAGFLSSFYSIALALKKS